MAQQTPLRVIAPPDLVDEDRSNFVFSNHGTVRSSAHLLSIAQRSQLLIQMRHKISVAASENALRSAGGRLSLL
jgi:hypothetical protein